MSQGGAPCPVRPHLFHPQPLTQPMDTPSSAPRGQILKAALDAVNPSEPGETLKLLARYTKRVSPSTSIPDPDNPGARKLIGKELGPPEFVSVIDDAEFTKFIDKLKNCAGNPAKFKDVFVLGDSPTTSEGKPEAAPPKPEAEPEAKPATPSKPKPKPKPGPNALHPGFAGFIEAILDEVATSLNLEGGDTGDLEPRVAELEKVRGNTKTFLLNLKAKVETLEARVAALEALVEDSEAPASETDEGL